MQFCLFSLLMLFSLSGVAGIYKWVDENGKTHFGDKPRQQKAINAEKLDIQSNNKQWQALNIEVLYQGSLASEQNSNKKQLDQKRIQTEVNWVYRFYDEILYFDIYHKVPVKINVLKNELEYQNYLQRVHGSRVDNSLGVYLPQRHEIAVYLLPEQYGGKEGTYRTIKHEASHAILHSLAGNIPSWLNEGMAEQVEFMTFDGQHFIIPRHEQNHRQILAWRTNLIPVDTFIEIDSRAWRAQQDAGKPTQSMAGQLVYLSLSKSYGRSFITRLLQDYKRGVNLRSFYLLDQHYIGGASTFKLHWQQWLSEGMAAPQQIILP